MKVGIYPNAFIIHDRIQITQSINLKKYKKAKNYIYSHILAVITNLNLTFKQKIKKIFLQLFKGIYRNVFSLISVIIKLILKSRKIYQSYKKTKIKNPNFLN